MRYLISVMDLLYSTAPTDFAPLDLLLDLNKGVLSGPRGYRRLLPRFIVGGLTTQTTLTPLFMLFGLTSVAAPWQYSFQAPHNDAMFWIIDLHADIMIFLVFTVGLVFTMLVFFMWPRYISGTPRLHIPLQKKDYTLLEYIDIKLHNHSSFYEMIWTVLPILLEFFIIFPSFIVHYAVSQTHPYYLESKGITTANTVRVVGNQWYWVYQVSSLENLSNFTFSTTMPITVVESYLVDPKETAFRTGLRLLEVDQPLCLSAGQYYKLLITSDDVIHSWAVPSLNVKVDACPGRLSELVLQVKDTGVFYGQCSELCGYYHGNMPIMIVSQ